MFNIQNYITRLILSKLERYLLNIKTEEFQLSLWQGNNKEQQQKQSDKFHLNFR